MTSLNVTRTAFQAENRSWLRGPHGTEPGANPSVTLDVSKFTAATHFPNGFIPSGTVLGKITATGKFGPYSDAATDGREVAAGLLFASLTVEGLAPIASGMVIHGFVNAAKLPAQSGLDAAARVDLTHIIFE